MENAVGPVAESKRLVSLDVLRGFALLGILTINIGAFSMPAAAYFDPTAYGRLTGFDVWVWKVFHVLGDLKFMAIFSMLFGAGIVLISQRCAAGGRPPAGLHYRRMAWLVVFGLLHAHLLWYGDVLYWYGLCGGVVYLFRRLSPVWLIGLGLLSIAVTSSLMLAAGLSTDQWPPDALEFVTAELNPPPEVIESEIAAYRGSWLEQMDKRFPKAVEMQTNTFLFWAAWRVGGLMLLGMALFKLGVLSATCRPAVYISMVAVAVLVGIPITVYGIHHNFASGWEAPDYFFLGLQFNYWASLLVSLGWIGVVMLICRSDACAPVARLLAPVGQTAFSNYILQTAICTTIFYGHGFGLFGQVERVGQAAIVLAIWAIQLIVSHIWLRHFRFGPLEWLWRSLVYLKWQPFRKAETVQSVG